MTTELIGRLTRHADLLEQNDDLSSQGAVDLLREAAAALTSPGIVAMLHHAGIDRAQKELRAVLAQLEKAELGSRAPVISRTYGDAQYPVMDALNALDRERAELEARA